MSDYSDHDPNFAIRETRAMLPDDKKSWYAADKQMKKLADLLEEAMECIELLSARCESHERLLLEKGVKVFNSTNENANDSKEI